MKVSHTTCGIPNRVAISRAGRFHMTIKQAPVSDEKPIGILHHCHPCDTEVGHYLSWTSPCIWLAVGNMALYMYGRSASPAPAPSASSKKLSPIVTCLCLLAPWGRGAVPGAWSDVCGFIKPPDSNERRRVRQYGAFTIHHEPLNIRQTDQNCHHEVWHHLDFVERRSSQSHHGRHESTNSLEGTFSAVPLQQTKGSHKRGCKRPFAFFVIGRPFGATSG